MGFSGGGSNVLLPHKHDGTVAQDGGPLDFDNVTQGDLTAGDVVFSDGVHLQRLAIGTPAQQIQVNAGATAPEYFTPAAAGSNYEHIASGTASGGTSLTVSFTGVASPDYIVAIWNGSVTASQGIDKVRVNGITTAASYKQDGQYIEAGGANVVTSSDDGWYGCLSSIAGSEFICNMEFHTNAQEETIYSFIKATSNKPGSWYGYGHNTTTGQTDITSITLYAGSAITGTLNVWAVRN